MKAQHPTTTMRTDRPAAPSARFAAAQAEFERHQADARIALWQPSSSRRASAAAGASAVALAAAIGGWVLLGGGPADHPVQLAPDRATAASATPAAPVSRAPTPLAPEATTDTAAASSTRPNASAAAAPVDTGCLGAGCQGVAAMPPIAAEVADPDGWALHPDSVPSAAAPSFTGPANVPVVADEHPPAGQAASPHAAADATGADAAHESAAGDAAEPSTIVTGGGYALPDTAEHAEAAFDTRSADDADALPGP